MTGALHKFWDYLKLANSFWKDKTQPVKGKSIDDKIIALQNHLKLDSDDQATLKTLRNEDNGSEFITRKVDEINDYASHRAAFLANTLAQLLLVNLSAFSLLSLVPVSWFKSILIIANLIVAILAWWSLRSKKRRLLRGPTAEPEWSIWGIFRGNRRKHNRHIKDQAQPYKVRMRNERLFSIMYLINAVTILFAGQFIFTDQLPSLLTAILNIPLFILTIPLAVANGYWAFTANNEVVKAATERGSKLDKLKI